MTVARLLFARNISFELDINQTHIFALVAGVSALLQPLHVLRAGSCRALCRSAPDSSPSCSAARDPKAATAGGTRAFALGR